MSQRIFTSVVITGDQLLPPLVAKTSNGIDSFVVTGLCGHSFHYDCIDPWIKTNKFCPICSSIWNYKK